MTKKDLDLLNRRYLAYAKTLGPMELKMAPALAAYSDLYHHLSSLRQNAPEQVTSKTEAFATTLKQQLDLLDITCKFSQSYTEEGVVIPPVVPKGELAKWAQQWQ